MHSKSKLLRELSVHRICNESMHNVHVEGKSNLQKSAMLKTRACNYKFLNQLAHLALAGLRASDESKSTDLQRHDSSDKLANISLPPY